MAKIITSKTSGKKYIQLESDELSTIERDLLAKVIEARKIERELFTALRDEVLTRDEFFDKGLTVYVDWGKVKVTAASDKVQAKHAAKPSLSLAAAMEAADLDGVAR